jgi:hypothetical protein
MAVSPVKAMSLNKKFLQNKIFSKYLVIASKIKERSATRYMKNVREKLLIQRQKHINEINKQSPYKQINIMEKHEINADPREKSGLNYDSRRSFANTPKGSIMSF